jgi:hypothetical protein
MFSKFKLPFGRVVFDHAENWATARVGSLNFINVTQEWFRFCTKAIA